MPSLFCLMIAFQAPYIEKSHQMMTFPEREKNVSSLYFKDLNVFFEQWIKETICVFKKSFKDFFFECNSM